MTVLVHDTFTGTNGTLLTAHTPDTDVVGGGWQQIPGTIGSLQIFSNAAVALGGSNGQQFGNYIETGESDVKITWSVALPGANVVYPSRMVFRYVDENNYLAVNIIPTSNSIYLERVVSGSASVIPVSDYLPFSGFQGLPATTAAGAAFNDLVLIAEGSEITLYRGDQAITYHQITDFMTATKHGLLGAHRAAGPTAFDNFKVETVPTRTYEDPVIWLKADEGAYTRDGVLAADTQRVPFLLDKSGRGNSALNHITNEFAYFDADGYNGEPAIQFVGSSSTNLQYALPASKDAGLTIFYLFKVPSSFTVSSHNDPMRLTTRPTETPGVGGNDDDRFMFTYIAEDGQRARLRYMQDGSFEFQFLSSLTPDDQWHLVAWSQDFANGTAIIRIDKSTVFTATGLNPPDSDYAWGGIGSALAGSYAMDVWVREFRGYDYPMSESELAAIEAEILGEAPIADELSATGIDTGAPTLGAPVLGQVHALTAPTLDTGAPVLGTPAVGQMHVLSASNLSAGAPVPGSPAILQTHALTASGIATAAPDVASPALGQVHALAAPGITTGAPVLDNPALDSSSATDSLSAAGITTGVPTLDSPALGQIHALSAASFDAGAPVIASPLLGQAHVFTTGGIVTGAPTLDEPDIGQAHTLAAGELTTGAPLLGAPTFVQIHALAAGELLAGIPDLEAPALDLGAIVTPGERTYSIPAELRVYTVKFENRTYSIKR